MLQVSQISEQLNEMCDALEKRKFDARDLLTQVVEADKNRRATQALLDQTLAEANNLAKEIGILYKKGEPKKAEILKKKSAQLKTKSKTLQDDLSSFSDEIQTLLYQIPNIPNKWVPEGSSDQDNEEVFKEGAVPELHHGALPHWELAKKYDIIDFELGNKITGAGFPVYKGSGARLQRALINYFLDYNTAAGYREIQVPHLVNEASGLGTGQLPDKEGQMYFDPNEGFYLIPTAEVPVTNFYRDEIFEVKNLPVYRCAYTPCFRREAGSWGADVRGLNRLHQFDKVELVKWTSAESSMEELEKLKANVEALIMALELPYRVLKMCSGDIGFPHAKQYDLEVFAAGQKRWLEVSSCSNFTDFQARRAGIRYRDADGKIHTAHTLNGSGLAIPRVLAAILENNLQEDGRVKVPKVLQKWMNQEFIGDAV